MVFFICNDCGESLKKQVVQNHAYRCNRNINVSCMDCLKDFTGKSYNDHTVCITEDEKYSAKGFVPKEQKGLKKQENWISTIRSIVEQKKNLPDGVTGVFEIIQRNDNIPRKQKGFINFFRNSAKHLYHKDVEAAWALIEQEVKEEKAREATNGKKETNVPKENGTPTATEPQKRKLEEDDTAAQPTQQKKPKSEKAVQEAPQNGQDEVEEAQPAVKSKKQKKKNAEQSEQKEENAKPGKQKKQKNKKAAENDHADETVLLENETTNGTAEQEEGQNPSKKFDYNEVIRNLLLSKNQMKLSKLKQKVMKRYTQLTGAECDRKFEKKFERKVTQSGYFVVENDNIRLVEA